MRYPLLIGLLLFSTMIFVDHHHHSTVYKSEISKPMGTALGLAAAQHNFDYGYKPQWSVGAGSYEDANAISFSLAKRLGDGKNQCKNCLLINGSFGVENSRAGIGIGINGRF